MTPDLKRLCGSFADPELDEFGSLGDEGREAIVRAVLMALREQMLGEGPASETELWAAADPDRLYPGTEGFDHQFANVIDHILADPVKA